MSPQDCVTTLLDPTTALIDKNNAITTYFNEFAVGLPFTKKTAMRWALRELRSAVPAEQVQAFEAILTALAKLQLEDRECAIRRCCVVLRTLAPGTKVVIALDTTECEVSFQELRRTRFLAEDHRGQLVSVPAQLFVRVAPTAEQEVTHASN